MAIQIPKVNLQTKLANTQAQQAARQAKGIATPGLDKRLGMLNTKIGNTQAQIDARNAKGLATPGLTNRLGTAPAVPAAQTPAATTPQPLSYGNMATTVPTPAGQGVNPEAMFPTTRMFEPQNYQGSPLYQFQVKAGEDQLAKSLAARGLTNSGYAIKQELNIPMMAAAQDTQRMTDLANRNADRLQQYQQNEALRQERAGDNQWDRSYQLAQLMAEQNPMQWAMSGLNNYGNTLNKAGQSQANYLAQLYQKVLGGGGGGAQPLPLPTGPNYNNINPAEISNNYNTNNGWINLLTQGLNSFFPQSQVK